MDEIVTTTWTELRSLRAANTEDGLQCAVLDLGTDEKNVQYAFSLDDLRELAGRCITVLAAHGDELAIEIGERYLDRVEPADSDGDDATGWRAQPPML